MAISSGFAGRIVQLTDALDRYDAVSNQVCELDRILRDEGFDTIISSRFAHPDREHIRINRDDLKLREDDVLIFHYYGFSEGIAAWLKNQYCTKILVYHNITPESFFAYDDPAYGFCKDGRVQLKEIIDLFSFYWGDSQFNIDELVDLGANADRCFVVPIIVGPRHVVSRNDQSVNGDNFVFVGRVAPNKGVVGLVDMFAGICRMEPERQSTLTIVGMFDPDSLYGSQVAKAVEISGVAARIRFTGKISDTERDQILTSATAYLSLSEHEGFGVPLIEAAYLDLPVMALGRAATAETLNGHGVFESVSELEAAVLRLRQDADARRALVMAQKVNAERFRPEAVAERVRRALALVIPQRNRFRTVSVVICTYNRRDYLERCLEYLTFQSSDNFEVIVVNGPSDDGTDEIIANFEDRIKIGNNPERNLSRSRNIGIDLAAGDIVAFIDDDALPFDDWISRILQSYNERPLTTAGLGGPVYYAGTFWFQAQDNGIDGDGQAKVNIDSCEIGRNGWMRYNTGTNATFVREHLVTIGGFDEQYDYFLDESELCFRLQKNGFLIGYDPEVYVRHEFAQSHNRGGKFNYNWFTICKNTAYFIITQSGRSVADAEAFITRRMVNERVAPLDDAVAKGDLTADERDRHVEAIWRGTFQGIEDAKHWPRTRELEKRPPAFLRYPTRTDRLAVGRDIPALHICVVSREAPPFVGTGGVGTLYYHLVSELLLMGHHVSLIVPSGDDRIHRQGRLSVYFTKQRNFDLPEMDSGFTGNITWGLSALTKLASVHSERPIDVVDSALWDTESLPYALLERFKRPPLVVRLVTPYAVSAEYNQWNPSPEQLNLFMEAERYLISHADAVIPISHMIASTLVSRYGLAMDERWSVGHCGIAHWPAFDVNEDYGNFPELQGVDTDHLRRSKLIVFIGRLERRKGIDAILAAAPTILNADDKAFLVVAGRDPENWADRFRKELGGGLADRFVALGEISNATREKLLAHAYCVLFPSRYESFGLVPLESFVHGTPVIASNSGAVPEVVIDDECGLLTDPNDALALADAVVRLLRDPDLRQRLGAGALRRVKILSARHSALHSVGVYASLRRKFIKGRD